jgi:hypothetical protein
VVSAGFADTIDTPGEQKRNGDLRVSQNVPLRGNTSQLHDGLMKTRSCRARNSLQKGGVRF